MARAHEAVVGTSPKIGLRMYIYSDASALQHYGGADTIIYGPGDIVAGSFSSPERIRVADVITRDKGLHSGGAGHLH